MLAPDKFVLPNPIDTSDASSFPPPTPSSYLKHQVYDNPNVFDKVDSHAIRVSQNSYPTFRDLLWDLVYRYKLADLEKSRVIFRWMTACDMNNLKFQTNTPGSPEEVLLSLKSLQSSYANVFELMCSYSGLPCLTVTGYAKGVDYRPGDDFEPNKYNHTWNVIYLQDSWQLIDAHWATRYLTSSKNAKDSIVYQYDDFYFIMEPQQAVYSHFPEDPAWQLLDKPLTLNQFVHLPLTKSQFFKCGMDFLQQQHGVVHAKDGNLTMSLGFWKPDSFTYKLQTINNEDKFNDIPLRYFILQETANNKINFYFRFPKKDVFYLTVYAQELLEHTNTQESVFRAACEYKIISDRPADNHTPYPMTCHDCNWGPSWSLMNHYGLIPSQEDGVISIHHNDPRVGINVESSYQPPEVNLEIPFIKKRDDVSLLCKLRKNGLESEEVLDEYIEIREETTTMEFCISLPEPGEYGLEIYANEPTEGDTYTHVCQYLLDFEAPPGYKSKGSVFGEVKPQFKPGTIKSKPGQPMASNNIRDMYNYEKDATPLGTLPQPYKVTQYAPDEATMIPGNHVKDKYRSTYQMIPGYQKPKPKPFAYQQQSNPATNKSDDSDAEMPDFLPPPPPPISAMDNTGQDKIQPTYGYQQQQQQQLQPQIQNQQQQQPGVSKSQDNNRPFTNVTGSYKPVISGGYQDNTSVKPMTGPGAYNSNINSKYPDNPSQYNVGGSKYPGSPNNSFVAKDPHEESVQRGYTENMSNRKPDPNLDSESIRLQPYLAHVEKGQSPQLSHKVYGQSGSPHDTNRNASPNSGNRNKYGESHKNTPPYVSSTSTTVQGSGRSGSPWRKEKDFSMPPPPPHEALESNYDSTRGDNVYRPSKKDYSELTGLNVVSNAFGKSESITDKQPYMSKLESGGSPNLARKSYSKSSYEPTSATIGAQSKSQPTGKDDGNINSYNDRTKYKESDNTNSDFNRPTPFRGYGRPNFSNNASASNADKDDGKIVPGTVVGQYQLPGQTSNSSSLGNYNNPNYSTTTNKQFPSDPVTSGFKEQQAKYGTPGYQMGGYSNKHNVAPPNDQQKDSSGSKVSNIAVTLTPSGFKKPDRIEITSDQYNKDYEGSRKIMPSPLQKYRPDDSTANWASGPVQKEPPKNFEAKPIVSVVQEKPKMEALPSETQIEVTITPEETSKIFQKVDEHAMQVSAQNQQSFNQLIWQLIYARNITDELEKVRVIFLWLCTKDLHKMTFDNSVKQDSPEEILMGIKNGKSTYAQVFQTLCRYAGIHCKLIVGYAKGADYVPGMKFQGRLGEHSWNAVLIGGVWRLVDCHWAARRLIGKEHVPENVRYELDMFYFLANPSQLVYTHFPHESDWQLLHHPVTIDEFESLAPVKSMFFKYNLDLVSHKNAVIVNRNSPEVELRIAFPKGIDERLLFTFTLTFNDGTESFRGISLNRYGRQELDFTNNQSVFWIRTPTPGSYKLLLYAKLINGSAGEFGSSANSADQKLFGAICEYKLESTLDLNEAVPPFPACQSSTYGPNEIYKRYAIEARQYCCSFLSESGTAEVRFGLKQADLRVMAKLVSNKHSDGDLLTQKCILQRQIAGEEAIITVFLPEAGEFGLEIYANDPKKNGNSFYTIWQYFVVSGQASLMSGKLPQLPPGSLGPFEPKFSQFGLSTVSHRDPFIMLGIDIDNLAIELSTCRERPARIMARLLACKSDGTNDTELPNTVLQQARNQLVSLNIRIPTARGEGSFYKVQVFALPYSDQSESLPGVYNYLIQSNISNNSIQNASAFIGYPTQFAQWREGCYLYSPLDAILDPRRVGDSVLFKMEVPRCKELAVVTADGDWTKLKQDGNGIWFGDVKMKSSDSGELSVCANYGGIGTGDSFTTILRYRVGAATV